MRALPSVLVLTFTVCAAAHAAGAVPTGCQEDYGSCKEDCTIEYGGHSRTIGKLTHCLQQCQESMDLCGARHSSLKEMRDLGLPEGARDSDATLKRQAVHKGSTLKEKDKAREDDPFGDSEPAAPRSRRAQEETFDDPPPPPKVERQGYRTAAPGQKFEAPEQPPAPENPPPAAPARQGVYRAADSEPAPKPAPSPSPATAPEPEEEAPRPARAETRPPPSPPPAPSVARTAAPAPVEHDTASDEEPPPPPRPVAKKPEPAPTRPVPPPEPKHDISDWDPGD
ncbi:hypothetical protein DRW03_06015 [Corallococcus sp. H22C18031201]|uniref:hypothetical protein n=1 Tax=Citreicoccus inhibens TaxID=2849499 RepID=UPI000E762A19|nr:hypothetical protein [Citreicoccus inhibens]MBU8896159.1 hypothetical protein [Citreicoccus inhibens]RJS26018.1 hypothetical protein DRW03_06015 [Corallococcus sp. H22C18031201]